MPNAQEVPVIALHITGISFCTGLLPGKHLKTRRVNRQEGLGNLHCLKDIYNEVGAMLECSRQSNSLAGSFLPMSALGF